MIGYTTQESSHNLADFLLPTCHEICQVSTFLLLTMKFQIADPLGGFLIVKILWFSIVSVYLDLITFTHNWFGLL